MAKKNKDKMYKDPQFHTWYGTVKALKKWLSQFNDDDEIRFEGGALNAHYDDEFLLVVVESFVEIEA